MKEQDIDNLFRDGLLHRETEFNMDSWYKMEKDLPKNKKRGGIFRITTAAVIVGVLLLGSVGILLLDDNSQGSTASFIKNQGDTQNEMESNKTKSSHSTVSLMENSKITTDNSISIDKSEKNKRNETTTVSAIAPSQNRVNRSAAFRNRNRATGESQTSRQTATSAESDNPNITREIYAPVTIASENELTDVEVFTMGKKNTDDEKTIIVVTKESSRPKVKMNALGFIGGISLGNSIENTGNSSFTGNEFFGITYQRYLTGGWMIAADLYYQARRGVNTSKTFDKKIYGFGSITTQKTVKAQKLEYIELPVLAKYSFGVHAIHAGVSAAYLINCKNDVLTTYNVNGFQSTEQTEEWGYIEGFNKWDASVMVGYEYMVIQNLNLGLRFSYGLGDITKNTYFGNDYFDNNVQLRVYLSYTPFNF